MTVTEKKEIATALYFDAESIARFKNSIPDEIIAATIAIAKNTLEVDPNFLSSICNLSLNEALSKVKTYQELEFISKNAKENISGWGGRYIYSQAFKGSVHIDALAAKIMEITNKNNCKFANGAEKAIAQTISRRINRLYIDNESRFGKVNIITRIFCYIRDLIENLPDSPPKNWGTRFMWEGYRLDPPVTSYHIREKVLCKDFRFDQHFNIFTPEELEDAFGFSRTAFKGNVDITKYQTNDQTSELPEKR